MAAIWLLPNRFYYCEFCKVYYTGMDTDLYIVPNPYLERHAQENKNEDIS